MPYALEYIIDILGHVYNLPKARSNQNTLETQYKFKKRTWKPHIHHHPPSLADTSSR